MKATHYGTCQICESVQKADAQSNRIAAHGYTLAYGWKAGTCDGSGQLPLEVSKDYAASVLAWAKEQVAAFVATPCPERTVTGRWDKCPAINAWKSAQQSHSAQKQYIRWTELRLANWVPRAQATVNEIESAQASAKSVRTGIRALSGAEKLAKRALVKHGEALAAVIGHALNDELYADRDAFWAANPGGEWTRWNELTSVPHFATNKVAAYVKLANKSGNADAIAGAAKLESLNEVYLAAKAAHAAAKA